MTDLGQPPYPLEEPEASVGDLFGRLTDDLGALFQDHLELAKEEAKVELKEAGAAAGLMAGAGLAGWMAALMLTFSAAWGLAEALDNTWAGFLIIGLIWVVTAVALWMSGRREMKKVDILPPMIMHELEEDKKWLSEQKS